VAASLAAWSALWFAALVWAASVCAGPRADDRVGNARLAAAAVYTVASRLCHQRADRSFAVGACPLPVCGRCAGLYAAAPIGLGIAALRRGRVQARVRGWLAVSAVPTAVTLALEWTGALPVGSWTRAVAAMPLGLAVAWVAGAAVTGDLS
jgi:uncharacterized membrane protein